jgi:hypothetical protein
MQVHAVAVACPAVARRHLGHPSPRLGVDLHVVLEPDWTTTKVRAREADSALPWLHEGMACS